MLCVMSVVCAGVLWCGVVVLRECCCVYRWRVKIEHKRLTRYLGLNKGTKVSPSLTTWEQGYEKLGTL